jgi:hypothetical protein
MEPEQHERRIVRVFSSHEQAERAEIDYWLALDPEQRLDAVGECVREYLALHHEPEQRLRRVLRVFERSAG